MGPHSDAGVGRGAATQDPHGAGPPVHHDPAPHVTDITSVRTPSQLFAKWCEHIVAVGRYGFDSAWLCITFLEQLLQIHTYCVEFSHFFQCFLNSLIFV